MPFTVVCPVPPLAIGTMPVKLLASAEEEIVISRLPSNATPLIFLGVASLVAVEAFPLIDPMMVLLNVLSPANICAPFVTIPPLVASAGAKLNTPDVMLAPLAVDVSLIAATSLTDPVKP